MPITQHPYNGAKDLAAMQNALAGWIHAAGDCGYCHIGDLPHRIYNAIRGRQPVEEMVRLWRDESEIVAFVIAYPRHNLYDAFLSPDHRGGELEREALTWGYTTTRAWMDKDGKQEKPVLTDAFDCDTVRAKLLHELGFTPDEYPWMALNERPVIGSPKSRVAGNLPRVILPEGYTVRSCTLDDAAQLAEVHSGAFGSNWTAEEYRDQVMLKPGYNPSNEFVVVAPDGRFAAFCIVWVDELNSVAVFEPVGTHKDFQRKGLARSLMAHCLRILHERGIKTAQVGSELDNQASNGLYQGIGFEPKYTMLGFHK